MTDTIDELSQKNQAITIDEVADIQKQYSTYNDNALSLFELQDVMNNVYRQMLDAQPRKLTKWRRFVYWIKDLFQ